MDFKTYKLSGIWGEVLGEPEVNGAWLIWGEEKNGKTTLALMLGNYLSNVADTMYISGEEGIGFNFRDACKRAGLNEKTRLKVYEYIALPELDEMLSKPRAPKIVVIDNITIYHEDLKYGAFQKLLKKHDDKLFIFLAHEDKKQPYTSSAKLCSRYAKVKIHVEGLKAFVSGRCPGGEVIINEEKAALYWGDKPTEDETANA